MSYLLSSLQGSVTVGGHIFRVIQAVMLYTALLFSALYQVCCQFVSAVIDLEWMLLMESIGSMVTVLWGHFASGVLVMYQAAAYVMGITVNVFIQLLSLLYTAISSVAVHTAILFNTIYQVCCRLISVVIGLEWMLMVKSVGSMVTVLWGYFSSGVLVMYQAAAYVASIVGAVLIQLAKVSFTLVSAIATAVFNVVGAMCSNLLYICHLLVNGLGLVLQSAWKNAYPLCLLLLGALAVIVLYNLAITCVVKVMVWRARKQRELQRGGGGGRGDREPARRRIPPPPPAPPAPPAENVQVRRPAPHLGRLEARVRAARVRMRQTDGGNVAQNPINRIAPRIRPRSRSPIHRDTAGVVPSEGRVRAVQAHRRQAGGNVAQNPLNRISPPRSPPPIHNNTAPSTQQVPQPRVTQQPCPNLSNYLSLSSKGKGGGLELDKKLPVTTTTTTNTTDGVGDDSMLIVQQLQEQLERERESKQCVVCMDRPRSMMMVPCKHFCACETCSSRLRKCPMCNRYFSRVEKIYDS